MSPVNSNGNGGKAWAFLENKIFLAVARVSMLLLVPAILWVHSSIEEEKVKLASHDAVLGGISQRLDRIDKSTDMLVEGNSHARSVRDAQIAEIRTQQTVEEKEIQDLRDQFVTDRKRLETVICRLYGKAHCPNEP